MSPIDEIRFHPDALNEARGEAERLAEWSYLRGREFDAALNRVLQLLHDHPFAGPADLGISRDGRVRRFVMPSFQTIVFYVVVDRVLWIVAVAPTKRAPGYWVERLKTLGVEFP